MAGHGPSASGRKLRNVERLTYTRNDTAAKPRSSTFITPDDTSTSHAPVFPVIEEDVPHSQQGRVGRPSLFSNRTLNILNTWTAKNMNATSDDIRMMHTHYELEDDLKKVKKWITNYKHRQSESYCVMKPTYASRRKIVRRKQREKERMQTSRMQAMTELFNSQPVPDAVSMQSSTQTESVPPPPPAPTSGTNQNDEDLAQEHDSGNELMSIVNSLFAPMDCNMDTERLELLHFSDSIEDIFNSLP